MSVETACEAVKSYLDYAKSELRPDEDLKRWFRRFARIQAVTTEILGQTRDGESISFPVYDDEKGEALIAAAMRGDGVADATLREIAAGLIRNRKILPPKLADYVIEILEGRAPKHRRKSRTDLRDSHIIRAIEIAVEHGVCATRNRASADKVDAPHSGAAIVSIVLNEFGVKLSEAGVEKIWERRPTKLLQ